MENFETFAKRNVNFGSYQASEQELRKCYLVACDVERRYQEKYGSIDGPRIGDIVEMADDFEVYKSAKIVENLYGGSEHGMLCICEHGTSHTDGHYFSTSGGAFRHVHKSKLQLVGEAENVVWSWGCYGAGANQGIYFPLKVRKWIIPYEQPCCRSWVEIRGRGVKHCDGTVLPAVSIETVGTLYYSQTFRSILAFMAWAEYVGFKYHRYGSDIHKWCSPQVVETKCYTDPSWQPPKGAKPIKVLANGRMHDGWVLSTDDAITYWWPNIYDPEHPQPRFGSEEYAEEMKVYRRYNGNPMGIEIR